MTDASFGAAQAATERIVAIGQLQDYLQSLKKGPMMALAQRVLPVCLRPIRSKRAAIAEILRAMNEPTTRTKGDMVVTGGVPGALIDYLERKSLPEQEDPISEGLLGYLESIVLRAKHPEAECPTVADLRERRATQEAEDEMVKRAVTQFDTQAKTWRAACAEAAQKTNCPMGELWRLVPDAEVPRHIEVLIDVESDPRDALSLDLLEDNDRIWRSRGTEAGTVSVGLNWFCTSRPLRFACKFAQAYAAMIALADQCVLIALAKGLEVTEEN